MESRLVESQFRKTKKIKWNKQQSRKLSFWTIIIFKNNKDVFFKLYSCMRPSLGKITVTHMTSSNLVVIPFNSFIVQLLCPLLNWKWHVCGFLTQSSVSSGKMFWNFSTMALIAKHMSRWSFCYYILYHSRVILLY